MPKAAVHENDCFSLAEYEIRSSRQVLMKPEPETFRVKQSSQS
jgi:hypothetical protein